jgi:hypothetical protein
LSSQGFFSETCARFLSKASPIFCIPTFSVGICFCSWLVSLSFAQGTFIGTETLLLLFGTLEAGVTLLVVLLGKLTGVLLLFFASGYFFQIKGFCSFTFLVNGTGVLAFHSNTIHFSPNCCGLYGSFGTLDFCSSKSLFASFNKACSELFNVDQAAAFFTIDTCLGLRNLFNLRRFSGLIIFSKNVLIAHHRKAQPIHQTADHTDAQMAAFFTDENIAQVIPLSLDHFARFFANFTALISSEIQGKCLSSLLSCK